MRMMNASLWNPLMSQWPRKGKYPQALLSPDMEVALDKGLSPTIPSTKIIGQVIIKEDNSSQ